MALLEVAGVQANRVGARRLRSPSGPGEPLGQAVEELAELVAGERRERSLEIGPCYTLVVSDLTGTIPITCAPMRAGTLIWGAMAALALVVGGFVLSGWFVVDNAACARSFTVQPGNSAPSSVQSGVNDCHVYGVLGSLGMALWIVGIVLGVALIAGAIVLRFRPKTVVWDGQQWVDVGH